MLAAREFRAINLCEPHLRLSPLARAALPCDNRSTSKHAGKHAGKPGTASPLLLLQSKAFKRQVFSQSSADEWRAVGAAAMLALLTLPRPFTLIESGGLCGGMTLLLALLKRHLCPSCRLLSLDPGHYRSVVRQPDDCADASLRWAGLREEVLK